MEQKRVWTVALVLALVPVGAQATPPIGGNTLSFGAGNDVGASDDTVYSVALGDLDTVSGSSSDEDYEVIVWRNDGSPFTGTWTPNNVGASAALVNSVAVGDLDDDGDLDIASGSSLGEDYEVMRTIPRHLREHLAAGHHVPGIFLLRRRFSWGQLIEDLLLIRRASKPGEYQDRIEYLPL